MINNFKNEKVLIFGLGLNQGGVGSAKFFDKQGCKVLVTDIKTKDHLKPSLDQLKKFKNITYTLGKHKKQDFDWADLIIKNPAIKPNNPFLKYAQKKGKQIEGDLGIFLRFVDPSQIIGVTGTKGKSTTAALIHEVLKSHPPVIPASTPVIPAQAGIHSNRSSNVVLAGNIGTSVLDSLSQITPNTLIILELSSFQLEDFQNHQVSPKWSVITNIFPDHLNYYPSMQKYIEAKRIIAKYQVPGDTLFLWEDDPITTKPSFLKNLNSKLIFFSTKDLPNSFKPPIPGKHNLLNFAAALSVAKNFGIDKEKALKKIANFKGLDFRLQLVKNYKQSLKSSLRSDYKGIKIYNDSSATNPDATIQALKALPNAILIAGGMNKKLKYSEFAKAIKKYAKSVYFLDGDATRIIHKSLILNHKSLIKGVYKDLTKLLIDVKKSAKPKDIILFSPGATSFNLFQNEFDRGRKFNSAVQKIFR